MRIFITGATGYIGRVVTERAVADGHAVQGLSRNDQGDARLSALGAAPVRGDLTSLKTLREASAAADAVLHLAYIHDFEMDYEEVLRIDGAAVAAIGDGLRGSGKPLVVTSGTAMVEPDPSSGETAEDAPISTNFPLAERIRSERHALSLSGAGVRVSAIRLPPYVYGRGGSYFMPLLMQMAAKAGESIYVDEGHLRTCDVHVDDAAALYMLAAGRARAGEVYNGTGSTGVTLRQLASTIGEALEVPVRSVSRDEAERSWGSFLTTFVQRENRPSNRKARQELAWQPKGVDMLTDIRSGSYQAMVDTLKRDIASSQKLPTTARAVPTA